MRTVQLFWAVGLAVVLAAGCDESTTDGLRAEAASLSRQRSDLLVQRANVQAAAAQELAGRPLDSLPQDSKDRLAALAQQQAAAEARLREVDAQLESLQYQLHTYSP